MTSKEEQTISNKSSTFPSDEWTIVTKNDKRRVFRINRIKNCKNIIPSQSLEETDAPDKNFTNQIEWYQSKLEDCIKSIQTTDFYHELMTSIRRQWQESSPIHDIVCYGIGNFTKSNASLWQLACTLSLTMTLNLLGTLWYYDPCTTPLEYQILSSIGENRIDMVPPDEESKDEDVISTNTTTHDTKRLLTRSCNLITNTLNPISILEHNDCGYHTVVVPTMFVMPHCPQRLYDNVLLSNWKIPKNTNDTTTNSEDNLPSHPWENIVIFGNSLRAYHENAVLSQGLSSKRNSTTCHCPSNQQEQRQQQRRRRRRQQQQQQHEQQNHDNDETVNTQNTDTSSSSSFPAIDGLYNYFQEDHVLYSKKDLEFNYRLEDAFHDCFISRIVIPKEMDDELEFALFTEIVSKRNQKSSQDELQQDLEVIY
jgi:SRR1